MITKGKDGNDTQPLVAVADSKEQSSARPQPESVSATTNKTSPVAITYQKVTSLDRETSDWLCDHCSTQNFAKLASGMPRLKCFKCQAAKSDTCSLVASINSAVATATAPSVKSNGSIKEGSIAVKAAPKPILDLQNKKEFVSQAERQQVDHARIAECNRKASYFIALRRANRPMSIVISPNMSQLIAEILGINFRSNSFSNTCARAPELSSINLEGEKSGFQDYGISRDAVESMVKLGLTPQIQYEAIKKTSTYLLEQGFTHLQIADAFESLPSKIEGMLDSYQNQPPRKVSDFDPILLDACLEYLCLHMDASDLPSTLDSSNQSNIAQQQLQVRYSNPSTRSLSADRIRGQHPDLVRSIASYGWMHGDIDRAITIISFISSLPTDTIDFQYKVLLVLLIASSSSHQQSRYLVEDLRQAELPKGQQDGDHLIEEEIESLQAIYGEDCLVDSSTSTSVRSLSIKLIALDLVLDIYIPSSCSSSTTLSPSSYPMSKPALCLVRYDESKAVKVSAEVMLKFQVYLVEKSWSLLGEVMIFSLIQIVMEEWESFLHRSMLLDSSTAIRSSLSTRIQTIEQDLQLRSQPTADEAVSQEAYVASTIATDHEESSSIASISITVSSFSSQLSKREPSVSATPYQNSFWSRSSALSNKQITLSPSISSSMIESRQKLPAWQSRAEFLSLLTEHKGIIVTGETGCGKTTQIPQFILETNPNAKIVVCQPRRLAAIGVASRVAEEIGCKLGDLVGYMIKGDIKVSPRTKLIFCTYGVILRRLQEDPMLQAIDYIILDEVHERNLDSDFALALLMNSLAKRSNLHLILMSATISTEKFSTYLSSIDVTGTATPSPILFISGFTYPVQEYFKHEIEERVREISRQAFSQGFGSNSRRIDELDDDMNEKGIPVYHMDYLIGGYRRKGDIDYDLMVRMIITLLVTSDDSILYRATGTILVFMPGVPEISKLIQLLDAHLPFINLPQSLRYKLMSLHGNLSPSEQRKVFNLATSNEIKIVVATNVAEASITIPDVSVVIDSCRVKEMNYDLEKHMSILTTKLASQDSLRQRRGRAGRMQQGRCFRMITQHVYEKLSVHSVPEILRTPLERLILQITATSSIDDDESSASLDVFELLQRCLDPPPLEAIHSAIQNLIQLQALTKTNTGELRLTALGGHIASLAAEPKVAKLLVYGALLGCVYSITSIAAYMASKNPFLNDPTMRDLIQAKKAKLAEQVLKGLHSDHLLFIEILRLYENSSNRKRFCREWCLSSETMNEILSLRDDYLDELVSLGFIRQINQGKDLSDSCNRNEPSSKLVLTALCAGLYPQVAKILRPPSRFIETIGGNLERDVEARELKYFVPLPSSSAATGAAAAGATGLVKEEDLDIATSNLQRVFIHPSSINFSQTTYRLSNYLIYSETSLSEAMKSASSSAASQPKAYLRDVSEVSPIMLLLFNGKLDAQYLNNIVTIDSWIRFNASGKIVALMQALRKAMDDLLLLKINDPEVDLSSSPILDAVATLIESDGMKG
jgi:HrpA-like RNA helicase